MSVSSPPLTRWQGALALLLCGAGALLTVVWLGVLVWALLSL